jgi:hypothetical protein
MRLRLPVGRVHGWCRLSKQPSTRRTCCTEVTGKGGGLSYELIVLLDSIIPTLLLLAKTRRHSGIERTSA